jgi:hypothetical protein
VATLAGMSWSKKPGLLGVLLLAQQAKAAARACSSAQAAPSSRLLARTRTCRACSVTGGGGGLAPRASTGSLQLWGCQHWEKEAQRLPHCRCPGGGRSCRGGGRGGLVEHKGHKGTC